MPQHKCGLARCVYASYTVSIFSEWKEAKGSLYVDVEMCYNLLNPTARRKRNSTLSTIKKNKLK